MELEIRRTTMASDPGSLTLSDEKLRILRPDLYGVEGMWHSVKILLGKAWDQKGQVAKQLKTGDSRAAMVVSVNPLVVAAYTDEMDCVVLLKFPSELVNQYGLKEGARLLTVNFYDGDPGMACDLYPGPKNTKRWTNFGPLIADFLTDDQQRLTMRKKQISDSEWQRTWAMGQDYLKRHSNQIRDGRPIYSWDTIQTAPPVLKPWSPK